MSTADKVVGNDTFPNVRTDINAQLAAIASQQAGTADPPAMLSYERQARTDLGVIRRRNAANGAWVIDGPLAETYTLARSSNTILSLANFGCTVVATSSFTQTLDAAATLGDGWWVDYRNDGTGLITLDPNSTEQIDGATTLVLLPGEGCTIRCNGSGFKTIGSQNPGQAIVLASGSFVGTPNLDFTGISQRYSRLELLIAGASSDIGSVLTLLASHDGGSTYDTTGYAGLRINAAATTSSATVLHAAPQAAVAAETDTFLAVIRGYQSGACISCITTGAQSTNGNYVTAANSFSTNAVTAIRVIWTAGAVFDAGTYALRGITL